MRISIRPLFPLLALLAVLGACTNTTPPATSPWSEVGISDFRIYRRAMGGTDETDTGNAQR